MTNVHKMVVLVLGLILLTMPGRASAQRPVDEGEALTGVRGFYVIGDDPEPVLTDLGLEKSALIERVETGLKEAGVNVLDEREWLLLDSAPVAYLDISASRTSDSAYSYVLALEVLYLVKPVHNQSLTTYATVWRRQKTGLQSGGTTTKFEDDLHSLISSLAAAYQLANADS